jgi:UDP-2-acetamido-2-deoxy-ribo-hexuluronate aminotransferase
MDAITTIAAARGLFVIEDAAQSFGAEYRGKRSCHLSSLACTSFFPSKPLGCYGDGGALFTDDPELARACREIRVHGQARRYEHTRIGVGGRMDTLQCAIVLAKLERFEWELERRARIGQSYDRLFDAAGVARVVVRPDRRSVFAQYTVFVQERARVQAALQQAGIPTAVHYPTTIPEQPAYQRPGAEDHFPNSTRAAETVLCLPMHADLDDRALEFVAAQLINAVASQGSS